MRNDKHMGPRELCTGGEWVYGRNPVVEVKKLAGRSIGNRCRLDRIVDLDGVSLGHAVVPKEIEI